MKMAVNLHQVLTLTVRNALDLYHTVVVSVLRTLCWVVVGRKYESPLAPDDVIWVDPARITHKPVSKPPLNVFPDNVVVNGDWDEELTDIRDDQVYLAFDERFNEGAEWTDTGYVDFLQETISEYGGRSRSEALERCAKMDDLYDDIATNGYKRQRRISGSDLTVASLTDLLVPPQFREISVDIGRNGEFLWRTGMHRLVIAQLLGLSEIPVRVNARHQQWQQYRESVYVSYDKTDPTHPDLQFARGPGS